MMRSRAGSGSLPVEHVEQVAERQRDWFGRSLAEIFAATLDVCALTQAQLGERLGISAPMVSQLMTGRREKPGNPLVQERIVALSRALDDFESERIDQDVFRSLVDGLGGTPARSSAAYRTAGVNEPLAYAQSLRNLFAAVASAEEINGAAKLLDKRYPELAEVLRVYGSGRTSEAVNHLERHGLA